ncbi:MAG: TlpA family protein disulfide reductase [Actinomycetota bacterium]
MDRLVVAVVIAVAVTALVLWRQRRSTASTPVTAPAIPREILRSDFDRPDAPWLVVVFTSSSCATCAGVVQRCGPLASDQVAVVEVEVHERADLHARYGIDSVPVTLIVDAAGEVVTSFAGPVSSTHLWAAVAEAREPGSTPPGCAETT